MKQYACYLSKDGMEVNLGWNSYEHIESAHPGCVALLAEAVEQLELLGVTGSFTCDVQLGRVVGVNHLVALEPGTEVRYAIRRGRTVPSRVVQEPPQPTEWLTVVGQKNEGQQPYIRTAWFGRRVAFKELTDPYLKDAEREATEAFWLGDGVETFGHAFAYDRSLMGSIMALAHEQVMELAVASNRSLLDARKERDQARNELHLQRLKHAA